MSASHRNRRVRLYHVRDDGTKGQTNEVFMLDPSSADDQAWWGSHLVATGSLLAVGRNTRDIGTQQEHQADAEIVLAAYAPATKDGIAVVDEVMYRITAISPRPATGEQVLTAASVDDDTGVDLVDA